MTSTPARLAQARDRASAARALAERFESEFGYAPDGVWSAPGRVNIVGEHVDYQDGLCLPMAISHRCFVAGARTATNVIRVRSLQADGACEVTLDSLEPGSVEGWAGYVVGVLWALRPFISGAQEVGLDLLVDGDVPLGAGLSSSAALECATAEAVEALLSLATEPLDRVRASIKAETAFVGASTGGLDQSASVLCTEGHALELDCRDFSTTQVPWELEREGLALLICDTRAEHALVGGEYAERRRASETAAAELGAATLRDVVDAAGPELDPRAVVAPIADAVVRRRAHHIVTEIVRVERFVALLRGGGVRAHLEEIGSLMDASHDSLRDDYEVTVPALDVAVAAARAAGAHGARMTGGGFGGSVIALVDADRAQATAQAIADAFARESLGEPHFFLASPAAGAGEDLRV